jgi:phage terminase large subunit GpA-like protein
MLQYEKTPKGEVIAESVLYTCANCKRGIDERHKQRMLDAGSWVHAHPDRRDGRGLFVRGFHINALYSPWRPIWANLCRQWVKAQDNPEKLRTFINLSLAETFVEGEDDIEPHALKARCTNYQASAPVPREACVLVATCDVQSNRVEIQHTAFGPGEQSWLIDHHAVWGNPGHDETWAEVDEWLLRSYRHESGADLIPSCVLIDSGDGGNTDSIYDFVLPRQFTRRRVYAIKGVDYLSKPGLAAEGTTKRARVRLFTVGTFACKDRIFARLKITAPGPGFINLPEWATDEYLEQLTNERKQPIKNRITRRVRYEYVQLGRNEALDLWVYAHAALFILQNFIDPRTYRDLTRLQGVVQGGASSTPSRTRRVRSQGID